MTIAGNQSADGGGLYHASIAGQSSTDVIRNTIVAGNTGGACGGFQPTIAAYLGDHDLDDDGTCGFTAPSDRPNANPLLGPLQNNGGPTDTRALAAGSPAIDAGDPATCLAADQRGTGRLGTCDIGAFEFVPPPPPPVRAPSPAGAAAAGGRQVRQRAAQERDGEDQAAADSFVRGADRGSADPGRDDRRHAEGPGDDRCGGRQEGRDGDRRLLRRHLQARPDARARRRSRR